MVVYACVGSILNHVLHTTSVSATWKIRPRKFNKNGSAYNVHTVSSWGLIHKTVYMIDVKRLHMDERQTHKDTQNHNTCEHTSYGGLVSKSKSMRNVAHLRELHVAPIDPYK